MEKIIQLADYNYRRAFMPNGEKTLRKTIEAYRKLYQAESEELSEENQKLREELEEAGRKHIELEKTILSLREQLHEYKHKEKIKKPKREVRPSMAVI